MHRLPTVIALNVIGIALYCSWYFLENHGVWSLLDQNIFLFFNHHVATSHGFAVFLAITNYRAFDVISLLAMGLLYSHYYFHTPRHWRGRLINIGIVMLLSAVVLNQLGHLLPGSRPSASLFFNDYPGVVRVSQFTDIPTKDSSQDSFPGDHGMMLMIFAGYMLRYFGGRAFTGGLLILVVFSMPRLMIGAHWFSDIAVGSLSIALVGLSWWLLTGASDRLVLWFDNHMPWSRNAAAAD